MYVTEMNKVLLQMLLQLLTRACQTVTESNVIYRSRVLMTWLLLVKVIYWRKEMLRLYPQMFQVRVMHLGILIGQNLADREFPSSPLIHYRFLTKFSIMLIQRNCLRQHWLKLPEPSTAL